MPEKRKKEKLKEMALIEHLREFRKRIIFSVLFFLVAFLLCYSFKQEIYSIITAPLMESLQKAGGSNRIIFTKLTEGFFSYLKLAAFGAFFLLIPFMAFQAWMFISPALYKKERKFTSSLLLLSIILFTSGVLLAYNFVLPTVWKFFLSFQNLEPSTGQLPLELEAKISDYLSLTLTLINAFGVAFQLPILLTLLIKFNIITIEDLKNKRRYAVIIAFITASILTPPDVVSQLFLAIPLILLYEISIMIGKLIKNKL